MTNEPDKLKSGTHDGIEEYDNDLPRWWLYLFYLTVVFGVFYALYYHVINPSDNQAAQFQAEMARFESAKAAYAAAHAPKELSDANLMTLAASSETTAKGRQVFATRCAACHGMNGEGTIGPNLTDKYWIHGGKISDLRLTVTNGVIEKGMPVWKTMLSMDEINNVVAFVWTLRGTTPANPKAPQGELIP